MIARRAPAKALRVFFAPLGAVGLAAMLGSQALAVPIAFPPHQTPGAMRPISGTPRASIAPRPTGRVIFARPTDRVAVSLRFQERNNSLDYRHSIAPGVHTKIGVSALAYNAENQLIAGALANPITISFQGTAVTVSPSTIVNGTTRLTITYGGTTVPSAWGAIEYRGGSEPVPYDVLTTGLAGCTAPIPMMGADTRGCLTVAPLIVTYGGALGPDLTKPLDVAGQLAGTPLSVGVGQDLPLSLFEARTGSADEPEVGETYFRFVPTMYDRGACTPQFGPPSAAGAQGKWVAHGYFFASPTIWYWNYGDPNCQYAGSNYFPPSGLSDVLDVGNAGARLPYGFNIHGDSTLGAKHATKTIEITDGHITRNITMTVTP